MSPDSFLKRDQHVGLVELVRQSGLPVVVALDVVDGAHLVWGFVVGSLRLESSPIQLWFAASPCRPLVDASLGQITMMGFVGLRAILDPVAASTDGVVVDVSEVSEPSSSTCSKEDPGVPDGDPSFPLSVEH